MFQNATRVIMALAVTTALAQGTPPATAGSPQAAVPGGNDVMQRQGYAGRRAPSGKQPRGVPVQTSLRAKTWKPVVPRSTSRRMRKWKPRLRRRGPPRLPNLLPRHQHRPGRVRDKVLPDRLRPGSLPLLQRQITLLRPTKRRLREERFGRRGLHLTQPSFYGH